MILNKKIGCINNEAIIPLYKLRGKNFERSIFYSEENSLPKMAGCANNETNIFQKKSDI